MTLRPASPTEARLLKIAELHTPSPNDDGSMPRWCPTCDGVHYPCITLRWAIALDPWDPGEEET